MEDDFYQEESRERIRQVAVIMAYQVLMNIIYTVSDFKLLFLINIFSPILVFGLCFYFRRFYKYIYALTFIYISFAHTRFLVSDGISKYTFFSNGQIFVLYYIVSPSDFIVQMVAIILSQAWVTYCLADVWVDGLRQILWTLTFLIFIRVQYIEKKTSYFNQQKQFRVDQIIKNNIFQQILITSFDYRTNLMNIYEKNEKMDQILNGQKNQLGLKKCLEEFEIVKANSDSQIKSTFFKYLQKKHFNMQHKTKDQFHQKAIKIQSQLNIPLQKTKNSSIGVIISQKDLKNESKRESSANKSLSEQIKPEYEFVYLSHNEQTFRARIQEVYLDQPLLMIIFENQEIVKSNTKLKKQLEVSNSVLLNFFQEVNSKCNTLKNLIFNNDIFNSKFLFQLLQNNIYSIQQYLRKRGINTQQKHISSANLCYFSNIENFNAQPKQVHNKNLYKQILKFDIFSDNKCIPTMVDISCLLRKNPHQKQRQQTRIKERKNTLENAQGSIRQSGNSSYEKNIGCLQDEIKVNTDKSNTRIEQTYSKQDEYFSMSNLEMLEEQNDFDYIDRIKLEANYNFQNIQQNSKTQIGYFKQIQNNLEQQFKHNDSNEIKNTQNTDLQDQSRDQKTKVNTKNENKIHFGNFNLNINNSFHNANNNNTSVIASNVTQNNTYMLNASNINLFNNQNNHKINNNEIHINLKMNEATNGSQIENQPKLNSYLPSTANFSNLHLNNLPASTDQIHYNPKMIDFSKTLTQKLRSHNRHQTQDLLRGNIKQFNFSDILEEIQIFNNQIKIKWDQNLAQSKFYSDKEMIVYILRSFLSSMLVINHYRKTQIQQLKQNLSNNQHYQPYLNENNFGNQINTIKPSFAQFNFDDQNNEDQNLPESCYSYNMPNQQLEESAKQNIIQLEISLNNQPIQNKQNLKTLVPLHIVNQSCKKSSPHKLGQKITFKLNEENDQSDKKQDQCLSKEIKSLKKHEEDQKQNMDRDQQVLNSNINDKEKLNSQIQSTGFQQKKQIYKTDQPKETLTQSLIHIPDQNEHDKADQQQIGDTSSEIDIPFYLYESELEFQLEKSKYCKSINVTISNISKNEILSCLNLNTNKEVNQTEYEIIKLIIQKIGPYPLFYEFRKISFSFLLDLTDIIEGQSFFNLENPSQFNFNEQNPEKIQDFNVQTSITQKKESSQSQIKFDKN